MKNEIEEELEKMLCEYYTGDEMGLHETSQLIINLFDKSHQKLKDIVTELAEWSTKYPRSQIYGMSRKENMDNELIAIEEKAKQALTNEG